MTPPREWYEPLIMPGIMTFAAVLVWFLAWNTERQGKRAPWKWAAFLLFGAAAFFAWEPFFAVQDYVYAQQFKGERKKLYAHHLGFYMPLVCAAGVVIWHLVDSRLRRRAPAATSV